MASRTHRHARRMLLMVSEELLANSDFDAPISQNASGAGGVYGVWQSVLTSWMAAVGMGVYNPASGPFALFQDVQLPAGTYQLTTEATVSGVLRLNLENAPGQPNVTYVAAGIVTGTQVHTFTLAMPAIIRINYIADYATASAAIARASLYRI